MCRLAKELISEFTGTAILMLFGAGVVAMVVVFSPNTNGGYINITLGWGIAVTLGIYASQYSGAHINPAVTIALAVNKSFPWAKVLPFIIAQVLGAFVGAALVYINYYVPIHQFDPELATTAGIFTTFPAIKDSVWPGFFDQILGTFLLMFMILSIGDRLGKAKASFLAPILIGLLIVALGMSFGALHGYAINPARDFGPRLFISLVGYKNNGLTDGSMVFLTPIIAPIIGAVLAAVIYGVTMGKVNASDDA